MTVGVNKTVASTESGPFPRNTQSSERTTAGLEVVFFIGALVLLVALIYGTLRYRSRNCYRRHKT
jgi:hypothetical protein